VQKKKKETGVTRKVGTVSQGKSSNQKTERRKKGVEGKVRSVNRSSPNGELGKKPKQVRRGQKKAQGRLMLVKKQERKPSVEVRKITTSKKPQGVTQ